MLNIVISDRINQVSFIFTYATLFINIFMLPFMLFIITGANRF